MKNNNNRSNCMQAFQGTLFGFVVSVKVGHDQHDQCRPAGERVASFARPALVIILFPNVSRPFEFLENVFNQKPFQAKVRRTTLLLNRTRLFGIMFQGTQSQIVDVDPDRSSPVRCIVFRIVDVVVARLARKTSQAKVSPQLGSVAQLVQDNGQSEIGRRQQTQQKGKQTDVTERVVHTSIGGR